MLVQPAADTFTLVSKDPSPSNLVAVTTPLILISPITRSEVPFAVVPIPTPSPSTANRLVPDPTWNVFTPGVVVPTPTLSIINLLLTQTKV